MARKRPARDVFVYFDNDMKVRAPRDAQALIARLKRRLGGEAVLGASTPSVRRAKTPAAAKRRVKSKLGS